MYGGKIQQMCYEVLEEAQWEGEEMIQWKVVELKAGVVRKVAHVMP